MRPENLTQYIGQQCLLTADKPLLYVIEAGHLRSMILWGPSGMGKTTLAEVIACHVNADVEQISAVTFGVKEIRKTTERAHQSCNAGRHTILFVDEVRHSNKSQQGTFLPYIEDGTITFIGAIIESPSFKLSSVLLSRVRVYLLKLLTTDDIEQVLDQAMSDKTRGYGGRDIVLPPETRRAIAELVNDDARQALNTLEMVTNMAEIDDSGKRVLKPELLTEITDEYSARFDNKGDHFYDLISASHKLVRGSASDTALYRYAYIISTGGGPLYVVRHCPAIASEDVGNTGPCTMQAVISAWDYFTRVGPTGDEWAIAQTIIYLTCVPKSSAVYTAFRTALTDVHERPDYDVPVYLRNAPTKLMREMGYGREYHYAHDEPDAYAAGEEYFPKEMTQTRYYHPTNRGSESKIDEKLAWLTGQDQNNPIKHYRQCCCCGNVVSVSL